MKPSRSCASLYTVLDGSPSATDVATNCGGAGGGAAAAISATASNGNSEKRYMYPPGADTATRALPPQLPCAAALLADARASRRHGDRTTPDGPPGPPPLESRGALPAPSATPRHPRRDRRRRRAAARPYRRDVEQRA